MRRLSVMMLVAVAAATGCSREDPPTASRAFCRAADEYNDEIEHARQQGEASVERQLPLVEELARTAPRAIARDARTFVDALERVASDPSVRRDPQVRAAVDNVNRFANQACNVYERRGP
jgi:hypothetical protein